MLINHLKIEGVSIAGYATNIRLPGPGFMFDIGRCDQESVKISRLFITHGHPDHIGGIVNYLFQRHFRKMSVPKIWLPEVLISPLKEATAIFSSLHNAHYDAEFIPVEPGRRYQIKKSLFLEAVPAVHTIPAFAYMLFRNRDSETPFLSYTGDTSIELLDNIPLLYSSELLLLETTFLCKEKSVKTAVEKKHIHLNQVYERAEKFNNKALVLTHLSARYSHEEIINEISVNAPEKLKNRITIF